MPEPSILDARLAEIDRRLRSIQSGLRPVDAEQGFEEPEELEDFDPDEDELDPPPPPPVPLRPADALSSAPAVTPEPAVPSAAAEDRIGELTDRLSALTQAHERLLELHRELLSQYAELLESRAADTATLAVTAGPFHSPAAVRAFEQTLTALPGVSSVAVREFVGDERVQVDVHIAGR